MKRYEKKTGVKPIRVHDLRHSHVAYLINQGVEPLIIKERLGHKNIQITLNTYGPLYPSRQKEAVSYTHLDVYKRQVPTLQLVRQYRLVRQSELLLLSPLVSLVHSLLCVHSMPVV